MRAPRLSAALAIVGIFAPALAFAGDTEWRRYVIPSTGTSVDMPVSIFTSDAGPPEGGIGRRFFTEDRRADLTVQSVANPGNEFARHVPGQDAAACRHRLQADHA